MTQKLIRVGNSYAVIVPKDFVKEVQLRAGDEMHVVKDVELATLTIRPATRNNLTGNLTPEFLGWLKKFNAKYKNALKELAKK